jgi:uncharacterized membrane protein
VQASRFSWFLRGLVVLIAGATVGGLVTLWPQGEIPGRTKFGKPPKFETAKAIAIRPVGCQNPAAQGGCAIVRTKLETGPDKGTNVSLRVGDAGDIVPEIGDRLRLFHLDVPAGFETDAPEYSLADYERKAPMLWLAVAFAVLVVITGRWRGLSALIGLGLSLACVVFFIVPAILHGESPLGVALIGSLAIMLATIFLAHGIGPKSLAALVGTTASLLLTAGLAVFATDLAHLNGFASEEAVLLQTDVRGLSIQGLLIAGMVIGALGVLDDVTISQASTVMALQRTNPALPFGNLFREALTVGRDHIAATVNTLILAYVGASLPVLLVFSVGSVGFGNAINSEAVAEQIIAMLVGSIGLIAAVPLTTALAALAAPRLSIQELEAQQTHAGHAH